MTANYIAYMYKIPSVYEPRTAVYTQLNVDVQCIIDITRGIKFKTFSFWWKLVISKNG
jgi:hypothetical protein